LPISRSALTIVTVAAASVLLLAGCSAGGSSTSHDRPATSSHAAKPQASDDADSSSSGSGSSASRITECTKLASAISQGNSDLSDALTKVASDPSAATAALQKYDTDFKAAAAKVTDPGVKAAADKVSGDLDQAVAAIGQVSTQGAGPLQDVVSQLQTDFGAIGTACAG